MFFNRGWIAETRTRPVPDGTDTPPQGVYICTMRVFWSALLSGLLLSSGLPVAAQSATPYTITLEDITYAAWPGLHSFVSGEWEGRRLVMCGRIGGLHAFLPPNPFMPMEANKSVWMFDPATGDMWEHPTAGLPDETVYTLESTNPQAFQRGKYLYIIGGYGHDATAMGMRTFPSLTAVDLEVLSDALEAGTEISGAFRTIDDPIFEVTGGEIGVIGDTIYLFGGHSFTGEYSKPAGPQFTQIYHNRLTKFTLEDDGTEITIADVQHVTDTIAFHRRDLNFEPMLFPGEVPALIALSGVFQYEADWVWFEPVFVTDTGYVMDESFMQKMNNYTCPVISLYDNTTETSYHTLFGGISQYFYDEEDDELIEDLNVPFVDDVTTVVRQSDGTMQQIVEPVTMDGLLGSNAEYWQLDVVPHYDNQVIRLQDIAGLAHIGYIFGGIDALIPNFTPSTASNRLFKVYIETELGTGADAAVTENITVFPNPASELITIANTSGDAVHDITVYDALGTIRLHTRTDIPHGFRKTIDITTLPSGLYIIHLETENKEYLLEFIRQ